LHPDRFAAAIGGIPVADYIACHEDASPVQQAWDDAINGGSPEDKPEYYRERSPITYVDRIRAPILMIAGENDSRCPIRQVRTFAEAVRERGGVAETHVYATGHHASEAAELADFVAVELSFLHRHVPGLPAPIE
jgi:dipeptidyl aminopeptidase/acylaminoacyl peptidase